MRPGPEKQFDTEQALRQAMLVFWARGYEAASMSELMGAMGIGKKSLYDTFGNKRELFLKSFEKFRELEGRRIGGILRRPGSPLGNLRALFKSWESEHGKPGSHGCFIGTNMADFDTDDAEIAETFRQTLKKLENMFTEVLTRAEAAGELTDNAKPRDLARLLVCLMQGSAIISRVMETSNVPRSAFTAALALLNKS
ncbi:MAG: TetR/AcrR family transcriptional regulator [Planctomycetota bacterium]